MGFGQITIAVYAALIFIGGAYGFIVKGSKPSIISSSILALILLAALFVTRSNPKTGFALALLFTLATLGRFVPTFFKTYVFFPNGLFSIVGVIAAIIIGTALLKIPPR